MAYVLALGLLIGQAAGDDDLPPPREYLYATTSPALARRLDCVIRLESEWDPNATAVRGRYVGLAQFDYPTWLETPQGQSGSSRWDPYASIDALVWGWDHLGPRRWPVSSRLC